MSFDRTTPVKAWESIEIFSLFLAKLPKNKQVSLPEKENEKIKWLLEQVNNPHSNSAYFPFWENLLSRQHYLLAYWKKTKEKINYRRFFSINELICLKTEKRTIFDAVHQRIAEEVNKGNFTGLRIDHIDGLFNPVEYLQRLKKIVPDTYTIAEKILQPDELMPSNFALEGNTGYDFLYYTNNLFCQKKNKSNFLQTYHLFTGQEKDVSKLLLKKKRLILKQQMYGDLNNLTQLFFENYKKYYSKQFVSLDRKNLLKALQEIMIRIPVYRTYLTPLNQKQKELKLILKSIAQTKKIFPELYKELDYLSSQIIYPLLDKSSLTQYKDKIVNLVMRWQQFTGPLMAKGMEDTLLYCYHPLLSLNEVGGEPENFGITQNDFYHFIQKRAQKWPYSINTTMTHDCKRGEDVRARINVLSEIPDKWQEKLKYWHQLNFSNKKQIYSLHFPDSNMEYFIYQTLIGSLPFPVNSSIEPSYIERVQESVIKSAREAKTYTSWQNPYPPYEEILRYFIAEILKDYPNSDNLFLDDLLKFESAISHYGILNSLSQVTLKLTCPGVPDFYQGSELWDFRLVDPDNRRPVDYKSRIKLLKEIRGKQNPNKLLQTLLANHADGKIKLYLISRLLKLRNREKELFLKGSFIPLEAQGRYKNHIISFLRSFNDIKILTLIPRFYTGLIKKGDYPLGETVWQDTSLKLPVSNEQNATEWISQQQINLNDTIKIGKILKNFPIAVIVIQKTRRS